MVITPAMRARDFVQTIGVCTHISWKNDGSAYKNPVTLLVAMAYLGISHIRDGVPYDGRTLPEYVALAWQGIKFNIIPSSPINTADDLMQIARLETAVPGSVVSIEGMNEFNMNRYSFSGVQSRNNPAWVQIYGPHLFSAIRSHPVLKNVMIIAPSMANAGASELQKYGNVSAFVDSSVWHVYHGNGEQPLKNLATGINQARSTAPGRLVTITETGYTTAINTDWGGAGTLENHAILTLNSLLDAVKLGAHRTYLYEILDDVITPAEKHLEHNFGLFRGNGTPKPAATAIRNLTTLLIDIGSTAATFTPASLSATFAGLPPFSSSLVLQKSDGRFNLIVWDEPKIWDRASKSARSPGSSEVTVNLGATYAIVKVFDPIAGIVPVQTLVNVSAVEISLGSRPIIIEASLT